MGYTKMICFSAALALTGGWLLFLLIGKGCGISRKNSSIPAGAPLFTISGKVVKYIPYCGGARPTPEILENAQKPHPYAHKKFYIITGRKNYPGVPIIKEIITNEEGHFSFQLPAGTYALLQEFQVNKEPVVPSSADIEVDEACMKVAWETPYYILEISHNDIRDLYFEFPQKCFLPADIPCLRYIGPKPQ